LVGGNNALLTPAPPTENYADGALGVLDAVPLEPPEVPLDAVPAGLDEDESLDVGAEEPESAVDAADVDVVDFLDPPESVL